MKKTPNRIINGFVLMEAGRWAKDVHSSTGRIRWEIEYDTESKLWHCRRNGILFDAGNTLREAIGYCVEPEGKPLIEIL